jgi:hypothetical protein
MEAVAWAAIGLLGVTVGILGARIDGLGSSLNARIDELGASLNARIDALAAILAGHLERHGDGA